MIAHGMSRGNRVWAIYKPRRGERKNFVPTFFCRSAALFRYPLISHGSRRGLPPIATAWLKYRSLILRCACVWTHVRFVMIKVSGVEVP